MQLVFAVVQEEDADQLCQRLNEHGQRVTRIRSTGGFLSRGNVTVVTGVDDSAVPGVLADIRQTCRSRRSFLNSLPYGLEVGNPALAIPTPMEVEIGGATVFTVPVRRYLRVRGHPAPPAVDESYAPEDASGADTSAADGGADAVDLIMAIVRAEDSEPVSQGLERAGFRLTSVPTMGSFLRRGNVTLLAAVPRPSVNAALEVIQANCRYRAEAKGARGEMPLFSAAVFVVELTQFIVVS